VTDSLTATLTVVGSGTLLPDAVRGSASFHVQLHGPSAHSVLMDVGAGTLHGLPRAGIDWRAIDTVALSHFHPDHISDLAPLLAAYRYEEATAPLTIVGPHGLHHRLEAMAELHGPWILAPGRPLTVVELAPGDAWAPKERGLRLEVHDTPHTAESVAYRLTIPTVDADTDAVVGYTGDTGPSDSLGTFLRGCHVVIAECALADPPEMDTHLSPRGVAWLAGEASPELLVLTHVYPPQRPEEAAEAVRGQYPGWVEAARDGMAVRIGPSGVAMDRPVDGP